MFQHERRLLENSHARAERGGGEREGEWGARYAKAVIEIKANYNWCVSSSCPSRCTLCIGLLCKTAWWCLWTAAAEFVFRFFLVLFFLFRVNLYLATENPQNCILLCMKGTNVSKSLTQGSALSSKPHLPPQKLSVGPPCGTVLTGGTTMWYCVDWWDHHVVLCWLVEWMMKIWSMNGC